MGNAAGDIDAGHPESPGRYHIRFVQRPVRRGGGQRTVPRPTSC